MTRLEELMATTAANLHAADQHDKAAAVDAAKEHLTDVLDRPSTDLHTELATLRSIAETLIDVLTEPHIRTSRTEATRRAEHARRTT